MINNRGTGPQSLPLVPTANNNLFPPARDPNSFLCMVIIREEISRLHKDA